MENQIHTTDDEISLKELILKLMVWYQYLLSKWKSILLAGIFGGLIGFTYAYFQKPIYTAETTFVLEEGDSGGGLGQYAGIASVVGLDMGGGGGGIFQGDNILELYKSRRMIQEALLMIDTFHGKQKLLINKYIEFNTLRNKWEENDATKNLSFDLNQNYFSRTQDSVLGKIVDDFKKNSLEVTKPDKKLSVISVKFNSKDELFAKSFTTNLVKKVNQFYVETKIKKSAENLSILQFQADSIRKELNSSISGVAIAVDANPNTNPAFQTLRVPSQRRQVDVQANSAAYQEIIKNLEIAKISLRKDKPLIQVIDEPILPLLKEKTSSLKGLVFGAFIFSLLCIVSLTVRKIYKDILK